MFLAAMSSSRSDYVNMFVCVCVCSHFVYFGAFKAVEAGCFNGVTGCLLGVSRVSQECLKDVSRVIQGCSKVATKFLKGVPRVF